MASLVDTELTDYIFTDIFPMEAEIDNWVNHDFWYTNQYFDHYDDNDRLTAMDLALPEPADTHINAMDSSTATSPIAACSPASVTSMPKTDLDGLLVSGDDPLANTVASIKMEQNNTMPALYIVANDAGMLAPNPNVPLQSPVIPLQSPSIPMPNRALSVQSPCSSYVFSESASSTPSPTASSSVTMNGDADALFMHEEHMMNYLLTDAGVAAFAKAHDVCKDDLISFLEMKKTHEDMDQNTQMSPHDHDEKHDEGAHKRRRHRGTYSKSTCLQVIEFVKKGYSARAAAKKFGIPKSTVHNWLHEDVSTRPEKGHRKKDLYHGKHEEGDHEHHRNITELGQSFAQTSITDEHSPKMEMSLKISPQKAKPLNPTTFDNSTNQPESQLVKLLTSNNRVPKIKVEPETENDIDDDEFFDIDCNFDELLNPEDWIEHEQWYKQQYLDHYYDNYIDNQNTKSRKSYGSYSNEQRLRATEYVRSGNTLSAASKEFCIPKSTIHTWLNEGNTPCELPAEVENAVVEQIEQVKEGEISPNLIAIKKKAEEVAAPRIEKFRASFAWCRDFMKRHYMDKNDDIDTKRVCRDHRDNKPSIDDLVSVLGLANANSEGPTIVAGNVLTPQGNNCDRTDDVIINQAMN